MEHFVRPPIEIICYTAGLLDGEGSIFHVVGKNRFGYSLSQGEKNDGETLCRWLKEQWGIGRVHPQQSNDFGRTHLQWHWIVNAAYEVQHGLGAMLPYLRVKRDAAERALAYIQQRLDDGVRSLWTPGEIAYLREHWEESTEALAIAIDRTPDAIREQRRVLGLGHGARGTFYWNSREDQYLRDNWDLDNGVIGDALGRTAGGVKNRRARLRRG